MADLLQTPIRPVAMRLCWLPLSREVVIDIDGHEPVHLFGQEAIELVTELVTAVEGETR